MQRHARRYVHPSVSPNLPKIRFCDKIWGKIETHSLKKHATFLQFYNFLRYEQPILKFGLNFMLEVTLGHSWNFSKNNEAELF